MPDYKYRAMDEKGKIRQETMVASNTMELEKRLNNLGYDLLSYKEHHNASKRLINRKKVKRRELINFTFQVEQLVKAGVPLIDSLKDIRDSLDYGYFTDILQTIIDDIEGGKTLSKAMAEHPNSFDKVYVTLIKVGEETGQLAEVLNELGEAIRWQDELVEQTKKIMMYPIMVTIVLLAVITFLMVYLMPQLAPFIKNIGSELPLYTKILIAVSEVFVNYWYIVFGLPIIIYFLIFNVAKKNKKIRYQIDKIKLKIWVFGTLQTKIKLARFANYFAMMYAAGITVLDALSISKEMMNNVVLEQSIKQAQNNISEGGTISKSFEKVGVFPSLIVRMLKVGEDTGAMDKALLNVSYFYNREVKELIEKIEPTILPFLTILLGLLMLWIMLSFLGPVYDAVAGIKL